jgi:hypothetical protein
MFSNAVGIDFLPVRGCHNADSTPPEGGQNAMIVDRARFKS